MMNSKGFDNWAGEYDEIYMVANEIESELNREEFATDYVQISPCAGVLKINL
jgi:hypothetical protein